MRSLLGRVILVVGLSLSSLWIFPATPFWLADFLLKDQLCNLMGIPLYVICFFSLATFNILSLYWVFDSLFNMCLHVFLFGFILYGAVCASWTWLTISFPILGKFSTIICSDIFSVPFFFSFSYGTCIIWMLVRLILSQKSLRLSSVLFILFSLFCSAVVVSSILSSRSLIRSSASVFLLLIPSREF